MTDRAPRTAGSGDEMWLVLCEPHDAGAVWAYQELVRREVRPVELLGGGAAAMFAGSRHELSASGRPRTDLAFPDGRMISGEQIVGVLNRIVSAVPPHVARAAPSDRGYAAQEFSALLLSWLRGLRCPVLNPPTPLGLSGRWRHPSEWAVLAATAGFVTRPYRETSKDAVGAWGANGPPAASVERTIIVVGQEVIGSPDDTVSSYCREISRLAETPLLGVDLAMSDRGERLFVGASPHPDLMLGGEALIDALTEAMSCVPMIRH